MSTVRKLDIQAGPSIRVETITPDRAREYLEHNTSNRPLSANRVKKIAALITGGHWRLTHQGIAFDSNGVLMDGQTRLSAIVRSGTAVQMMVARNCDPQNFSVIDTGTARNSTDYFSLRGFARARNVAAVLMLQWQYEHAAGDMTNGTPLSAGYSPGFDDLGAMSERLPMLAEIANTQYKAGDMLPPSWSCFLRYHFGCCDSVLNEGFWPSLIKGANLEPGNPILALRQALIRYNTERAGTKRQPREMQLTRGAVTIKAWNALRSGKEIKTGHLRWRNVGPSSEGFPLIK